MARRGVFRKERFYVPLFRRGLYKDEGTTSEGEGPAPSGANIAQGLHRITDGWYAHPVSKLGGWLQ